MCMSRHAGSLFFICLHALLLTCLVHSSHDQSDLSSAEVSLRNTHSTFPMFHGRLLMNNTPYCKPKFFFLFLSLPPSTPLSSHTLLHSLPLVQPATGLFGALVYGGWVGWWVVIGVRGGESRHSEEHAGGDNNSPSGRPTDASSAGNSSGILSLLQHKLGKPQNNTSNQPICFYSISCSLSLYLLHVEI